MKIEEKEKGAEEIRGEEIRGKIKRRDFLALSATAVATVVCAGVEIGAGIGIGEGDHFYVFVVDTTRCIGCGRCVIACKIENDVPEGFFRTWVERYVWYEGRLEVESPKGGFYGFERLNGEIDKSYFVPKLCNHCENPPCVQVCPVGATYKTKDGVVLVDEKYCIGCRYCIQACPYGARYIYPSYGKVESRRNTADKCTWCYHRITKGLKPACVEVCPNKARLFGDLKNPEDPIREVLKRRVSVLKPEQGTKPKVFYIGIDSDVR